jgi:hypothetical protein
VNRVLMEGPHLLLRRVEEALGRFRCREPRRLSRQAVMQISTMDSGSTWHNDKLVGSEPMTP